MDLGVAPPALDRPLERALLAHCATETTAWLNTDDAWWRKYTPWGRRRARAAVRESRIRHDAAERVKKIVMEHWD